MSAWPPANKQVHWRATAFFVAAVLWWMATVPSLAAPNPPQTADTVQPDDIVGELLDSYTWTNDTLLDIARAESLGLLELLAANPGVDRWLPGKGEYLLLPTAHILPNAPRKGIVINLAELRLYYFDPEGEIYSFPIGVGRGGFKTPVGQTRITRKRANPEWYPTASTRKEDPELPARVAAGPDNPLGEYALYLGWPTYLVHGTSKPWGVGRRVSRGCIRLYPEDIAWLFEKANVGTPVTIVDEPVKYGRRKGDLYVEVHPSKSQLDEIEETGEMTPEVFPDFTDEVLAHAKVDEIPRIDWVAVERAFSERRGFPVRITRAAPQPEPASEVRPSGPIELPDPRGVGSDQSIPQMPGAEPPKSTGPS